MGPLVRAPPHTNHNQQPPLNRPAVIARHAYRVIIRHKADHPWTNLLLDELGHLQGLPAP
ncbi:hypothetical protein CYJ18_12005 [Actinomyces naeslundii]|nr:hypothetical protein CYJ18_12005 [Actinomyces naeslundii]